MFAIGFVVKFDVAESPTTRICPSTFFAPAVFRDCRRCSRLAGNRSSSSSFIIGDGGRAPRGSRAGPGGPSPRRFRPRPKASAAADALRLDGPDEARVRASRGRGARVDVRVRRDGLRL